MARAPIGYRYTQPDAGDRVLVKDEQLAPIIHEALDGFATGRFRTRVEVRRFLEAQAEFPRSPTGHVHAQRVTHLLRQKFYAGQSNTALPELWAGKGQHEPLISLATYMRIQERLSHPVTAPARKDLSRDFPLRGCIRCADCGTPLTAAWSCGRSTRYPYYRCYRQGCACYRKSTRREVLEHAFEAFLQSLEPTTDFECALRTMIEKAWDQHVHPAASAAPPAMARAHKSPAVFAHDPRLRQYEEPRIALQARVASGTESKRDLDTSLHNALAFLANPCQAWKTGSFEIKRIVIKLAFTDGLTWSRHRGLQTVSAPTLFKLRE